MNRNKTIFLASATLVWTAVAPIAVHAQTGPAVSQKSLTAGSSQKNQTVPAAPDLAVQIKGALEKAPAVPQAVINSKKLDTRLKLDLQKFKVQMDDFKAQINSLPQTATAVPSQNSSGTGTGSTPSTPSPTTSTPPIPSSDSNYLDDALAWSMPIHIYPTGSDGLDLTSTYCLPAETKVVGLDSQFTKGTPPDTTTAGNYLPVRLDRSLLAGGKIVLNAPVQKFPAKDATAGIPRCDNIPLSTALGNTSSADLSKALPIFSDTQFFVGETDLEHTATREGWDFGTLVVPFKFQMSDKTTVTGSATLGGYLGYRVPLNLIGFRFTPMIFLGVSEVPTTQTDSTGATSAQTVAGLSYGFGFIGKIKDDFNIGLVFGADHVNSGQPYQYQDKPWVSLSLGYSLTSLAQ